MAVLQARPEPIRDRWGRYVIPDPVTGEERSWIRDTTWASTVADNFALTRWQLRMVALGLARRSDLMAGVAAVLDPETKDGKRRLDQFVEDAKEHAGGTARSTIGTALHSFAEAVDTDRQVEIPAPWDRDIEAYRRTLRAAGIKVSANYVEKVCLVQRYGVAGTMDRLIAFEDRILIGDLKTGRDLVYSWTEIAIQLALYAHADTVFDPIEKRHRPMLAVDQEKALVIHLPAGEGRCTLYLVDIAAGWQMAEVCGAVRDWRARRDLATPLGYGIEPR